MNLNGRTFRWMVIGMMVSAPILSACVAGAEEAPASAPATASTDPLCVHWAHLGVERPASCGGEVDPVVIGAAALDNSVAECDPARSVVRAYEVVAFFRPIVYNKFGDFDPLGMMYSLKEDRTDIEAGFKRPRPLVLRANVGECVEVTFTNGLAGGGTQGIPANPRAGIHFHGPTYDPWTSAGSALGFNPDTQVSVGETITYRIHAAREGVWLFHDHGTEAGGEADGGSNVHGLFGAFVVEPAGSEWRSAVTGQPTVTDLQADILVPGVKADGTPNDFRELVVLFHDEAEILNATTGEHPVHPATGQPDSTHAINYGAEPERNRHGGCPECIGEETALSSWPYGDPSLLAQFPFDPSNVFRAYVGDAVRIRLAHAGVAETHVFHWHGHQWRHSPDDETANVIDSVTISPGQALTLDALFGAGSLPGAPGDYIFHCHLYPHFASGMWGHVRVLDRLEDGTRRYPDGTLIPTLRELPDRAGETPAPTPQEPGFPHFIPGAYGHRAPQAPYSVFDAGGRSVRDGGTGQDLPPTPLEQSALKAKAAGAPMVDPCPATSRKVTYNVTAIQLNMSYNRGGWFDPQARILVPSEQEADVRAGRITPEPLVFRANAGDCVIVRLTNHLPLWFGGNEFVRLQRTNLVGQHVHLVKFDPLGSDGASNGWNYVSGAFENQTLVERWYIDEELRSVFTHDHFFANVHQKSGLFGALVAEPKDATYRNPVTGAIEPPGKSFGTRKDILVPGSGNDFREFVGFVQDFVPQFLPNGSALNPPPYPDSPDDPGVMGFNYRNEPLALRAHADMAHYFSSWRHGDPSTPVFETYAGDPVRFRLMQGSQEEQHGFMIHGVRWLSTPGDPQSPLANSQTIGLSEAFNFEMPSLPVSKLASRLFPGGDYLYASAGDDDLTLGVWGIMRAFDKKVSGLLPLPDRTTPPGGGQRPAAPYSDPPAATDPGNPCPPFARERTFEVAAVQLNITYNRFGDHDPHGLVFVAKADAPAVLNGTKRPEPLTLRANAGECITVHLENLLPSQLPRHDGDASSGTGGAAFPIRTGPGLRCGCTDPVTGEQRRQEAFFPDPAPSVRVGLTPQVVLYSVTGSDGTAVGFNPDQTVAPGGGITYRWFAPFELGGLNLLSYGDYRNHRHHGLFAGLVVQPFGSVATDPETREPVAAGTAVDVRSPSRAYRDFVVYFQDGLNLRDETGRLIRDPEHELCVERPEQVEDAEDSGEKAFNYRSERFCNRLAQDPDLSLVTSSRVHGDPATPIFRAYAGDGYAFRVLQGADQPRNHAFHLEGAAWRSEPNEPDSLVIATQGGVTVGRHFNVEPLDPAGGPEGAPGDYAYRCMMHAHHFSGGLWGIFRVLPAMVPDLAPLRADTPIGVMADSFDPGPPNPYDDGVGEPWLASAGSLWHLTKARSMHGYAAAFQDNGTRTYDLGKRVVGTLRVAVDLVDAQDAQLSFYAYRDVERSAGAPVDLMRVLVRPETDSTWTVVKQWDSRTPLPRGWVFQRVDLNPFAGQRVDIAFHFDSVDGFANAHEGWYLDDIRVTR